MTQGDWRGLIDGLIEAVLIVDAIAMRVVEANGEALRLMGYSRDSLLGRSIADFAATPEDIAFWEDAAAGISNDIFSATTLRCSNGDFRQVERRVSRVKLGALGAVFVVGIRDQTKQREVENELERLIGELRATLESSADGILVIDPAGVIRAYNKQFSDLWLIPQEMLFERNDRQIFDFLAQAVVDRESYLDRMALIEREPLLQATEALVLRSGRVLERITMPQFSRGRPIGRVFSFRDITQRLADVAQLHLAAKVFETSLDAILILDADLSVVAANPSCARLTEGSIDGLIDQALERLIFDPDDAGFYDLLLESLATSGFCELEGWYRRADGSGSPGLISVVQVPCDAGSKGSINTIVFIKDLSERFEARKRIDELSYSDSLTGLPNRVLLHERLQHALDLAQREALSLAVFFVDLDRFKQINDSLGHEFGDRVLVEVAGRIRNCLRQSDTAARIGGDEFVLLLHDADVRGAEHTARRIFEALAKPITLDDMRFVVSCSIGIALFPDDGTTIDELIKNADTAMYGAKDRGRSGFRFYQKQMNIDLLSRMKLESAIRFGIDTQAFRLHYQPQIDLVSGRIIGCEALLRWNDPELGEVSPGKFIPVAEESGLIAPLGQWVLATAVKQAMAWKERGLDLVVAVNVSALQFQLPEFVDSVRALLKETGLPPHLLELEMTESILVKDAEEALSRLNSLSVLGVRSSIDDFGTGYSSLSYLKKFPIQKLKIDRSFISGLPSDESDIGIALAVIQLGVALKLKTIAEGVETREQFEFLRSRGCNEFQGFLCAPALPPEAFEALYTSGAGYWIAPKT